MILFTNLYNQIQRQDIKNVKSPTTNSSTTAVAIATGAENENDKDIYTEFCELHAELNRFFPKNEANQFFTQKMLDKECTYWKMSEKSKPLIVNFQAYPQIKTDTENLSNLKKESKSDSKSNPWPKRKFPILVGAISKNHLKEMETHIGSLIAFVYSKEFQKYFDIPEEIVIWNIDKDIEPAEKFSAEVEQVIGSKIHEVDTDIKTKIKLTVKNFPFKKYPSHVKDLHTYAWKVIINTLMIIEYGNLWWFDASVVPKPQRYEVLAKMVSNQLDENVIVQSKDGNQNRKTAFIFMPPSTLHGLGWATCKQTLDQCSDSSYELRNYELELVMSFNSC